MPPVEGSLATLPRTRSFAPFPCLSGKVLHKAVDPVLLAYISKRDDVKGDRMEILPSVIVPS